jgi:dihydropteroate synthase
MGVVNVTPDSFSDGGVNFDPGDAAAAARRMLDEGAAIIDVGGESTRPGSEGVSLDEELRRVVPVLEALEGLPLSIDTAKSQVAARALELGAELVNDVTALRGDPELAGVAAEHGAYVCLMHMRGEPRTMQDDPRYEDVVADVARFLDERLTFAVSQGIPEELICLDPGIGFGKTVGDPDAKTGTAAASLGAAVLAYERGASIFRVHDVREHVEALTAARAVMA